MNIIKMISKKVEVILNYLTIFFFVLLLVLLFVNIFFRMVPIYNLSWFDEAVEFSFAWLVFLGAALLWYKKEHSRVDLLPDLLKGKISAKILDIINEVLSIIFALIFTYFGFVLFGRVTALSAILQIPRKYFYLAMPLSGILMIIYSIGHLYDFIVNFKKIEVDNLEF
ncbi:MAG: TRAP transporter small permease [Tenericutes bacterium]|nr:TRAP transporter small permease [Mycoplasmatota bacterium]